MFTVNYTTLGWIGYHNYYAVCVQIASMTNIASSFISFSSLVH